MRASRHCPAVLIAAPASGQGKTTVTAALARLHRNQGRKVRVFKCGPDFLDPMILERASGAPVYQLDMWMVGEQESRRLLWEAAAEAAWQVSREMLRDPAIGLVVLDELNIALKHGYLDLEQVLSDLQARPPMQHVLVTGRGAKPELIDLADTVTEMGVIKHAFQAGIKAQKGIEL